jgi:hypothetical protein
MTAIENSGLIRIEEKVDKLMEYMAASNERVPNCKARFTTIETSLNTTSEKVDRLWLKAMFFCGICVAVIWFVEHYKVFGSAR